MCEVGKWLLGRSFLSTRLARFGLVEVNQLWKAKSIVRTIYSQIRQSGWLCFFVHPHWCRIQLERPNTLVVKTGRLWET